jgi:hypothetical protein
MGLNNPFITPINNVKTFYLGAERACLALIYAPQHLQHYFLAYKTIW